MRGARKAPVPRDSLNFRRTSLLSRNEFESGTFTIVFHATSSFTYVSVIYGANFPFKAGPPLDLSFWSFLTFLHHGIEKVETHLLWKFHKQIQRKSWSNVPPKLLTCIGFLYKVVHKNGRLRTMALGRLNLTFLPLGLSLWNLAHLFTMCMATKRCLRFFNFCLGT